MVAAKCFSAMSDVNSGVHTCSVEMKDFNKTLETAHVFYVLL